MLKTRICYFYIIIEERSKFEIPVKGLKQQLNKHDPHCDSEF